jgi:hypothetical protein
VSDPREPAESRPTVEARRALVILVAATLAWLLLTTSVNYAVRRLAGLVRGSIGDVLPSYLVDAVLDGGLGQAALLVAGVAIGRRAAARSIFRRPDAAPHPEREVAPPASAARHTASAARHTAGLHPRLERTP